MEFLFTVMLAAPRRASASFPVTGRPLRSTNMTWLSVRPETIGKPRAESTSAMRAAFAFTCVW